MPTNPTDPFDLAKTTRQCSYCGKSNLEPFASIPAMRRAVVEWLQNKASTFLNHGDEMEAGLIGALADQLERGGHER